ncbi:MAG TPA: methyltransferase domain-containing protein [Burkholderiaceae bacterium]|nr:methyltransferase domain-containing protein [Burkholderiaceae bacterium]
MSSTDDRWERGDPYERYIGRWSRRLAPHFLSWLDAPPHRRWLDVGCGTGALTSAILERANPATVSGVEPSDGFLTTAAHRLGARAQLHPGTAAQMPLPDAHAEVTVSGLVLNFTPDPAAALAEMQRVTAPGGTVAAYVWDYAEGMQLIRCFWDAARALDERAGTLDEAVRFPLCHRDALAARFSEAGLQRVQTAALEIDTRFEDFDDYWLPFLGGQGPAPAYAMSLDDAGRSRLRDRLRATLPVQAGGAIVLRARAWAVQAQRA